MIEQSLARHGVDLVWLEHTHLLPLAGALRRRFPKAALVCNSHNVLSRLHDVHAGIMTSNIAKRWHRVEARACYKMECEGLAKVDQVFCCSELDRDRILKLSPRARVKVWPNGVDPEFFQSTRPPVDPPLLLLPGSLNYVPNSEGARWFVQDVLPRIHAKFPACRLRIAGRGAEQTCGQLAGKRVEALSDVPDMRPHFEEAALVIVPLRAGSGTRLKILEAMAMERAVVSTTVGAEGLNSERGRHLLLADDPEAFASAILKLLGDPALCAELGRAGRELIQGRYDWKHLSEKALA
jgi:glycosyltransferase involved in cell wall biosynthesis